MIPIATDGSFHGEDWFGSDSSPLQVWGTNSDGLSPEMNGIKRIPECCGRVSDCHGRWSRYGTVRWDEPWTPSLLSTLLGTVQLVHLSTFPGNGKQ